MRAMRAEGFRGYEDLKLADIPKPAASEGRVLVPYHYRRQNDPA
jgi:NADPH2:quinone reductase